MEERIQFIHDWKGDEFEVAELCRSYGVTRRTGYKWIGRYEREGLIGLEERSSRALHHPNELDEAVVEAIVQLKRVHPLWGARKLRALLASKQEWAQLPAASTIGALLKRAGLTVERKRKSRATPNAAPLAHAASPNSVWCADFKGWFRTGDGSVCHPLTITDACSRFLLRCQGLKQARGGQSRPWFEATFREYGMPVGMRTDNGAPFASVGPGGLSGLAVWLIKLGIRPERIEPGKPGQNGRHERMHRTLKAATANPPRRNFRAQQQAFDEFRREYNQERPHEALGQTTPASCYQSSTRGYPSRIREVEYGPGFQVRRVSPSGQIRWQAEYVHVGRALTGEPIGLEQIDDRYWRVWFGFYEIGVFDSARRKLVGAKLPRRHSGS